MRSLMDSCILTATLLPFALPIRRRSQIIAYTANATPPANSDARSVARTIARSTVNASATVITATTRSNIDAPNAATIVWTEEGKRGLP